MQVEPEFKNLSLDIIKSAFGDVKEMHFFLTIEAQIHLPPVAYVNAKWMVEIWKGTRPVSELIYL